MLILGSILFCFLLVLFWRGVVFVVGKIGKLKGQEQKYRKYATAVGIFITVATVLFFITDEIYTKKQFEQLCKKEAGLKIYKTVENVDGFLHMSDINNNPKYFVKEIKKFKFHENLDRENKYKIKEYYTKKENNQYIINYFVFMTERKYIGKGKYKETLMKENKIDFDKYKINRYSFTDNDEYSKEENIQPRSRYVLLETLQPILGKFGISKKVIFDKQDYSILAEYIVISNGGGKLITTIGDISYGGSYVGDCGRNNQDLIKQVFQLN